MVCVSLGRQLAACVFTLSVSTSTHYSEMRKSPQILPNAAEDTAADLVKSFWLYGLHVQLPANQMLSYTK